MYIYVCPKCRYTDVDESADRKCLRCGTPYVPLGISTAEYNKLTEAQRTELVDQKAEPVIKQEEPVPKPALQETIQPVETQSDADPVETMPMPAEERNVPVPEESENKEEETTPDDYFAVRPRQPGVAKTRAKRVGETKKESRISRVDDEYVPGTALQTNRGLFKYIIFSILTLGIYGAYFLYKMAKDVNVACSGDGQKTSGLIPFIIFSVITCGIYSLVWEYKLANRLAENSSRYGLNFQENGTTILLWYLLGSMLCGIGPYIAMNILIKNTNRICAAFNSQNGLG